MDSQGKVGDFGTNFEPNLFKSNPKETLSQLNQWMKNNYIMNGKGASQVYNDAEDRLRQMKDGPYGFLNGNINRDLKLNNFMNGSKAATSSANFSMN